MHLDYSDTKKVFIKLISLKLLQEWRRRGKLTVCLMVKLRFRLGLVTEKTLAHCTSR